MSPLVLKLHQEEEGFNFSNLNQDELSKTWRVCTKVKDSLENGSRLENLSWRLWFRQNVTAAKEVKAKDEQERKMMERTIESAYQGISTSLDCDLMRPTTENFTLNQFTSDQANDQMVQLTDIFCPLNEPSFLSYPIDRTSMLPYSLHEMYPYPNVINPLGPVDMTQLDMHLADSATLANLPNVTLYNKMLTSLPRETLVSAERLLSPQIPKKKVIQKPTHYYNTFKASSSKRTGLHKHVNHTAAATHPAADKDPLAVCSNCQASSSPFWRRTVDDQILCNACGLYFKLHNSHRPKPKKNESSLPIMAAQEPEDKGTQCSNCGTSKTPLWRRNVEGSPLCNACGLYLKLHNEMRPLSMKTDTIKKRQRTETLIANDKEQNKNHKRPRYYDQQTLMSNQENHDSALPGTGILMMSNNTK